VYIHDLDRGTTTRLTFTGTAQVPVWAPDGKHIVFRSGGERFLWVRSDGRGEPLVLFESPGARAVWSFSPDGRLAYVEYKPDTSLDIWTMPLDLSDPDHPKPGQPEPFLETPAAEFTPRFSPDGRWIAYRSSESGTDEIYVRPFPPGSGGKWQISDGGGSYGIWSPNGRELFYEAAGNRIMVLDYRVDGNTFIPGKPRLWSDKQLSFTGTSNLDIAPDGRRFLVFALPETPPGQKVSVHVTMLLNFFDEVKRRIP
jgi:serine/threonine-protein kinase